MRGQMQRVMLGVIVAVALLGSTPDRVHAQAAAQVRVVHMATGLAGVDVVVDGQRVLRNLGFTAAAPYTAWPAGTRTVRVTPTNQPARVLINAAVEVTGGQYLTLALTGTAPAIAPLVLLDDNTPPPADHAKVRFVHGATDVPPVNVISGATQTILFPNVAFRTAGGYQSVPAGAYELDLRPTDQPSVSVAAPNVTLVGGQIVTIFAVRSAPNAGAAAVSIVYPVAGSTGVSTAPAPVPLPGMPATGVGSVHEDGPLPLVTVLVLSMLLTGLGWISYRHLSSDQIRFRLWQE